MELNESTRRKKERKGEQEVEKRKKKIYYPHLSSEQNVLGLSSPSKKLTKKKIQRAKGKTVEKERTEELKTKRKSEREQS